MRFYIDAGHGGSDPGACCAGVRECDLNLAVAIWTRQGLIEAGCESCDVALSRGENETVSLADRVSLAREFGADVFLSVHCDAALTPHAHGQTVFVWQKTTVSEPLGVALAAALAAHFPGRLHRGLKRANYYVLRQSHCPAALVECEFLSNQDGRAFLSDPASQQRLAAALADGLLVWNRGIS